jgi:prepilin-type N-terminal cleavage/methylation domain-containing protein
MKALLSHRSSDPRNLLGFTLVELLIVMGIIGVLATFFIGSYTGVQRRARDANRKSDLAQMSKALELYFNDYRRYPAAAADASGKIMGCPYLLAGSTACVWDNTDQFTDNRTVYYKTVPGDPQFNLGALYLYRTNANGTYYKLYAKLENPDDPDIITVSETGCFSGSCNFAITSGNTTP